VRGGALRAIRIFTGANKACDPSAVGLLLAGNRIAQILDGHAPADQFGPMGLIFVPVGGGGSLVHAWRFLLERTKRFCGTMLGLRRQAFPRSEPKKPGEAPCPGGGRPEQLFANGVEAAAIAGADLAFLLMSKLNCTDCSRPAMLQGSDFLPGNRYFLVFAGLGKRRFSAGSGIGLLGSYNNKITWLNHKSASRARFLRQREAISR